MYEKEIKEFIEAAKIKASKGKGTDLLCFDNLLTRPLVNFLYCSSRAIFIVESWLHT